MGDWLITKKPDNEGVSENSSASSSLTNCIGSVAYRFSGGLAQLDSIIITVISRLLGPMP